jgi:hypothetical protein
LLDELAIQLGNNYNFFFWFVYVSIGLSHSLAIRHGQKYRLNCSPDNHGNIVQTWSAGYLCTKLPNSSLTPRSDMYWAKWKDGVTVLNTRKEVIQFEWAVFFCIILKI